MSGINSDIAALKHSTDKELREKHDKLDWLINNCDLQRELHCLNLESIAFMALAGAPDVKLPPTSPDGEESILL